MPANLLSHIFPMTSDFHHSTAVGLCFSGEKGTCKTSMLFQAAVNVLNEDDEAKVVFISPKRLDIIPTPIHHMKRIDLEKHAKRFVLHYTSSAEDLLTFLATQHTQKVYPRAIIIDDLDVFMRGIQDSFESVGKTLIMAQILAQLFDYSHYCAERTGKPCYSFLATNMPSEDKYEPCYEVSSIPTLASFHYDVLNVSKINSLSKEQHFLVDGNQLEIVFYPFSNELFLENVRKKE